MSQGEVALLYAWDEPPNSQELQSANARLAALAHEVLPLAEALEQLLGAFVVSGPGGPCFRSENDVPMGIRPFQRRAAQLAVRVLDRLADRVEARG